MNKTTGRFKVFFAATFLFCLLLTGCQSSTPGTPSLPFVRTIPVRLYNQTGRDITASIVSTKTTTTDWGDTYETANPLITGYTLAAGGEQEVTLAASVIREPIYIYIKDSTGSHWFFNIQSVPTPGDYVNLLLRMDGDRLVADADWGDGNAQTIQTVSGSYQLYNEFSRWYYWDMVTYEEFQNEGFWFNLPGANDAKWARVFGSADAAYGYSSKDEAAAHMVRVSFPVWKMNGTKKVSSTATIWINSALADEVVQIFTEIYNDPEQFPINSVGGYSWRGDSSSSEHNPGCAIDINANENYQIRYGNVVVGSFWDPSQSVYSIPEDGSVVRIFEAHGWSWGGDAWSGYTTPSTTGNHDYMHFSYFGT